MGKISDQFARGEGFWWNLSQAVGILTMTAICLVPAFMLWIGTVSWIGRANEWFDAFLKSIFGT